MTKRTIWLIIVSMGIALLGSILLQMYWIRLTLREQEEQFDREVNQILGTVVEDIDKRELKLLNDYIDYSPGESQKLLLANKDKGIIDRLGSRRGFLLIDSLLKKKFSD